MGDVSFSVWLPHASVLGSMIGPGLCLSRDGEAPDVEASTYVVILSRGPATIDP